MSINPEQVKYVANLARIEIAEEDVNPYAEELSRILDLVEQMNAVDTENIEPMAHPQTTALRMREDVVTETNQRDEFQNVAPATQGGLYLVPKVIE